MNTEVLIFECAGNHYGIEAIYVAEVLRAVAVTPAPQAPPEVLGLIDLRGELMHVLDARTVLRLSPRPLCHTHQFLVLQFEADSIALHVDRTIDLVGVEKSKLPVYSQFDVGPNRESRLVEFNARSGAGIVSVLSAEVLVRGWRSRSIQHAGFTSTPEAN